MPALLPFSALEYLHWSDTPMWVFDLECRCMRWANPAGLAFWNAASLEEFLARDFSDLSPATITRNKVLMQEHAAGRTGRMQWTVYPLGRPTTLNAHTTGVLLQDGRPAILFEAHQIPQGLDPMVLRGVETMQQTPVIVELYRMSDGSVVLRNPAGVRAFGTVDLSLRHDAFAANFVEPSMADQVRQTVLTTGHCRMELQFATLEGPRWYSLDARTVTDPVTGEALVQVNAQDINELKEAQEELSRAKESAESANLAKNRFLSTMSHEIRTPMNGILGMAQLLLMPELSEAERQEYTRTILASGQTLLTLLNDILDLSKIEAGKFQLESVAFDPEALMRETRLLFSGASQANHLLVEDHWSGPPGQRYQADAYRLRQMLNNLVGNAIKFTQQGSVRIEGRELSRDGDGAMLEFGVRDTGIGIAEDKLALLFKPFSQADSSTTRQFGGSGLGLSIVRNLAMAMGGEVGVDTTLGVGSRFWFRVRVELVAEFLGSRTTPRQAPAKPDAAGNARSVDPDLALVNAKVLVVEDNPANRMFMKAVLIKMGVKVSLANDGQQALDAVIGGAVPDVILMDINMPVMDGYLATTRLREWEIELGRQRVPIIALTADAFEEDRKHCLAVGMDDFLSKPVAVNALKEALTRWLHR